MTELKDSFTSNHLAGRRFREAVHAEAVALYKAGHPMDAISAMLGTTKRSVANWVIKSGTPRRKHTERFNVLRNQRIADYFENPTDNAAYILGYTMADGSVMEDAHNAPGVFYHCKLEDRSILDGIARELGLEGPQILRRSSGETARLRIYGLPIASAMSKWGIVHRKSFKDCVFPSIPTHLVRHYIRGVFDGDGCIHHGADYSVTSVQFLGSKSFLTGLRDRVSTATGVRQNSVLARPGHYCVAWQNVAAIRAIYGFLYPPGEYLFLARKKAKFEAILCHEYDAA